MLKVDVPRGYIDGGPFCYHYDTSLHSPRSAWRVWDGERWLPFESNEASALLRVFYAEHGKDFDAEMAKHSVTSNEK